MDSIIKQHPSLYKIVVSHYLIAAISFLALGLMLFFAVADFGGHYFQPHILAVTHTAALGWGTVIIFGACYQLMPVILEANLHSYKLAWFGLLTFYLGLLELVYSFWVFEPGLHMQCGSLLLLTGIGSFSANMFITSKKIKKPDIYQDFILTSCIWLLVTALLGVLMVFNFRYPFLPQDHLLFLKLHAHAGLAGWFLLLIIGVSSKLLPMFLLASTGKIVLLKWSYYLINIALLLFCVNTYIFGLNLITYFIVGLAVAGLGCWFTYIYQCFTTRNKKTLDLPVWHTLLSLMLLAIAILVLPFIIYNQLNADALSVRLTVFYGCLLVFGWITSLILGQTFKTLPFIVWTKRHQFFAGTSTKFLFKENYNARLLKLQFLSFLIFIITFTLGVLLNNTVLRYIGAVSFLTTAVCYLANVCLILFETDDAQ